MSQFQQTIVAMLHARLNLDGLSKADVTKAKRANIVENGDTAAVKAAAALHENGIDATWLCPDGKLVPVDVLAKVTDLVANGADVTALQQFSPSQILAGLSSEQLASLKPAPVVEEMVEAPVAEVVAEAVVVETAPEAPVAEVKVEAPKPTEFYPCQSCGEKTPADKLFIPTFAQIRTSEGMDPKALLTEAIVLKHARRAKFTRHTNSLVQGLETIRNGAARHAELETQRSAWLSFCKELKHGEMKEYNGTQFRKCTFTGEVFKAELALYPGLDIIVQETKTTLPNGKVINVVPTFEVALRRFTCGPRKQKAEGLTSENGLTAAELKTAIADALNQEQKQRDQAQAKREREERQRQGGNRNQQMSRADELAGLAEYRSNQEAWTGARRERGSRGDQNRASSKLAQELADS